MTSFFFPLFCRKWRRKCCLFFSLSRNLLSFPPPPSREMDALFLFLPPFSAAKVRKNSFPHLLVSLGFIGSVVLFFSHQKESSPPFLLSLLLTKSCSRGMSIFPLFYGSFFVAGKFLFPFPNRRHEGERAFSPFFLFFPPLSAWLKVYSVSPLFHFLPVKREFGLGSSLSFFLLSLFWAETKR